MARAGRHSTELKDAVTERTRQRREDAHAFGLAIKHKLREDGHLVGFDGRLHVLSLWPTLGDIGQAWPIRVERISRQVDFDLLVRMEPEAALSIPGKVPAARPENADLLAEPRRGSNSRA